MEISINTNFLKENNTDLDKFESILNVNNLSEKEFEISESDSSTFSINIFDFIKSNTSDTKALFISSYILDEKGCQSPINFNITIDSVLIGTMSTYSMYSIESFNINSILLDSFQVTTGQLAILKIKILSNNA